MLPVIFEPEIATMEASWTELTAIEEAMTVDGSEPATKLPGVRFVNADPSTAGNLADPSNCTSLLATLKVLPCFVTLDESIAELATLPVIFDPETPTIEAS